MLVHGVGLISQEQKAPFSIVRELKLSAELLEEAGQCMRICCRFGSRCKLDNKLVGLQKDEALEMHTCHHKILRASLVVQLTTSFKSSIVNLIVNSYYTINIWFHKSYTYCVLEFVLRLVTNLQLAILFSSFISSTCVIALLLSFRCVFIVGLQYASVAALKKIYNYMIY